MIVVGAKGLAQEVLDLLDTNNQTENLVFFDDININEPDLLFNQFPILRTDEQAQDFLQNVDNRFIVAVGFPDVRYLLYHKFIKMGGQPVILYTTSSMIGKFNVKLGEGTLFGFNCAISNSVTVGKGAFINALAVVGHDSIIGEFCVICPSVNIAGHVEIGDYTFIGTGAIIYPKVKIGSNVSITAGSVIRKNIPDNSIVHGNPAKIIGKKPPFKL